ncbi:unnamed protein product [Caenorhabditis auriculariae]|uniref:Uncharacterized protein n=1 Tax=Caenorhabditis auriculariae TaxID=2777116 RepID=A0A8S1HWM8_9PELO|nr:unnamed protein product [Caenorhabditis auriculariae]
MSIEFGKAEYVNGRSKKNLVFLWESREHKSRVYEFIVSAKFKADGLVSWKCVHCMKLRDQMKKDGKPVADRKIPLVHIDKDIIKENPEHPFNAEHFCTGRDIVDSAILRAKLSYLKDSLKLPFPITESPSETTESDLTEVVEKLPLKLDASQKRRVTCVINRTPFLKRAALRQKLKKKWTPEDTFLLAVEKVEKQQVKEKAHEMPKSQKKVRLAPLSDCLPSTSEILEKVLNSRIGNLEEFVKVDVCGDDSLNRNSGDPEPKRPKLDLQITEKVKGTTVSEQSSHGELIYGDNQLVACDIVI